MEQIPEDLINRALIVADGKSHQRSFSSESIQSRNPPSAFLLPSRLSSFSSTMEESTTSGGARDGWQWNGSTTSATEWSRKTAEATDMPAPEKAVVNNKSKRISRSLRGSLVAVNNRSSTPVQFWRRALINSVDARRRESRRNSRSNTGLLEVAAESCRGFQYAVTPALEHGEGQAVMKSNSPTNKPEEKSVNISGLNYIELIKIQLRRLFSGCPFAISIRVWKSSSTAENKRKGGITRRRLFEQTLRIKNSREGGCVFQVTHSAPNAEELIPLSSVDLHFFFRFDSHLIKSLEDWNSHYQNPPAHWVVNFIPKAYLRRGHRLAEEMCEYFEAFPDGCRYRIEYEPIGHAPCLVGVVNSQIKKIEGVHKGGGLSENGRIRHPSWTWEKLDVEQVLPKPYALA